MNFSKLIFRSWFYFRAGYNTYIAFFIGFSSNVIVIYKLGIAENKFLGPIFASLTVFAIIALAVLIPVSIAVGLYHMKRTGAYAAEASVSLESNPYIYKLVPGKEQEVFLPLWILTVRSLERLLEQDNPMTQEERQEMEDTLKKATALMKGQSVGHPRQQMEKAI